jgi:uroporphyrinogen-III synthase
MLFDLAGQSGVAGSLEQALRTSVVIASIGEVTSRALGERNLVPAIVPAQSKMGALVQAVGEYFRKKNM